MIKIEINPDKRIYLGQNVVDTRPILDLQRRLADTLPLKLSPPDTFHMTLLHYGKARGIEGGLACLPGCRSDLGKVFPAQFAEHVERCLIESYFARSVEARAVNIDVLGHEGVGFLVLRLEKSNALTRFREDRLSELNEIFAAMGVKDIAGFYDSNPDLRFQPTALYTPHITLGTLIEKVEVLPSVFDVQSIFFDAPRLFNVGLRWNQQQ